MTVIVISAVSAQVLMSLAKTLYVVVEVGQTCGLLMEEFEILLAEIQLKVFPPNTTYIPGCKYLNQTLQFLPQLKDPQEHLLCCYALLQVHLF